MIWFVACTRADPELERSAAALRAWEQGKDLLAAGDAAGARERFHAAGEVNPSPLLSAWEAEAAAAAGDLEGAIGLLDRALAASAAFDEARYDRAAYLARLGRPEAAAEDLAAALASGTLRPLSVLEDPDFAPYLDHPAFQFLPRQPLHVAVTPPAPTAFWGAEVALRIRVLGLVRPPISFAAARADGPLQLVGVVEDTVDTVDGAGVELVWTWKVVGGGVVHLGPTTVTAGKYSASVDPITIAAEAPPDKVTPALEPLALPTPTEVASQVPERSAAVVDGRWVARAAETDRVVAEPASSEPVRFERRDHGRVVETVYRWPAVGGPVTVRLAD